MKHYIILLISFILFFTAIRKGSAEDGEQFFSRHLFSYKPIYVLAGNKNDTTKLQFSFKYNIFTPYPIGLFFAYTQLTFWNPYQAKFHFHDINFIPEFFLEYHAKRFKLDFIRFGLLEHKSNNQDDEQSRSWNRAYLQGQKIFNARRKKIGLDIKVFKLYNKSDKNQDILKYIGYYESKLFLENDSDYRETLYVRWGTGKNNYGLDYKRGWIETGFYFRTTFFKFNPVIYVQVWHGYGEYLLDYNKKETKVRAGLRL